MDDMLIIFVVLVIALAVIFGIYSYWNWSFHDQIYNVSGVVSAYHKMHDMFGYTEYNMEFYGGSNVNWTQNKGQFFIFSYVGQNVNASAGDDCNLQFKGAFMVNASCTSKG